VLAGVERLGRVGNLVGGGSRRSAGCGRQAEHGVGFDGDAVVDESGSAGVAELVDVDLDTGLLAVAGPAVVGGMAGSMPSTGGASVDAWDETARRGCSRCGPVDLGETCTAGMADASKQFRRVNGHLHLPAFRDALERHVADQTVGGDCNTHDVSAA